jgi:hypothetical protein
MAEVTLAIGAATATLDGFGGELRAVMPEPAARADATAAPIRPRYTEAELRDLAGQIFFYRTDR